MPLVLFVEESRNIEPSLRDVVSEGIITGAGVYGRVVLPVISVKDKIAHIAAVKRAAGDNFFILDAVLLKKHGRGIKDNRRTSEHELVGVVFVGKCKRLCRSVFPLVRFIWHYVSSSSFLSSGAAVGAVPSPSSLPSSGGSSFFVSVPNWYSSALFAFTTLSVCTRRLPSSPPIGG